MAEAPDDLLDLQRVCRFFGGSLSPIDRSTLYKGIRRGRYPKPIKLSPKMSRWSLRACEAALDKIKQESRDAR